MAVHTSPSPRRFSPIPFTTFSKYGRTKSQTGAPVCWTLVARSHPSPGPFYPHKYSPTLSYTCTTLLSWKVVQYYPQSRRVHHHTNQLLAVTMCTLCLSFFHSQSPISLLGLALESPHSPPNISFYLFISLVLTFQTRSSSSHINFVR